MHARRLVYALPSACLLAFAPACEDEPKPASDTTTATASDTTPDSADVAGTAVADFCPAFIAALCDAEATCCTGQGKWPSAAVCVQGESDVCSTMTLAFSDPRLAYDATRAATYLAGLREAGGRCELGVDRLANGRPAFLVGTVKADASCTMTSPEDVIGRWSCMGGGVCHPVVAAGALAPGVCGAPSAAGESCIHNDECAEGLHCVGAGKQPAKLGVCESGEDAGATCADNRECAGGACDKSQCLAATVPLLFCMNGPDSGIL